jgi:hypothetical protein
MVYLHNSANVAALCQIAEYGKDDNAGKDGGKGVEDADEKGVAVAIVVHVVVAGQHQLTAKPNRQREQDL